MSKPYFPLLLSAVAALTCGAAAQAPGGSHRAAPAPAPVRTATFGQLPLAFEPSAAGTSFTAHGPGYTITLASPQALLALGGGRTFRMSLAGARASRPQGARKLASYSNVYAGNDPKLWRSHIPNFAEVQFEDVYPGIGLRYYGRQGRLEADFNLAAGADAGSIKLVFPGAAKPRLQPAGALTIGPVVLGQPRAYQLVAGGRRDVAARYVLHGGQARIALGAYDRSLPLVIDPTLSYSYNAPGGFSTLTGLGPAIGILANNAGDPILVAGAGDTCGTPSALNNYCTISVWELNPAGTAVNWRASLTSPNGIDNVADTLDGLGDTVIAGTTYAATGFPTTPGAIQSAAPTMNPEAGFVAKFDPNGNLVYSTMVGAAIPFSNLSSYENDLNVNAIAADPVGDVYIAGSDNSSSGDIPQINSMAFACDVSGGCVDGFIAEINPTGTAYLYGSYLTTADNRFGPPIMQMVIDRNGNLYIGSQTSDLNDYYTVNALEPTCPADILPKGGCFGYIAEVNPNAGNPAQIVFATYLEYPPAALAVDNSVYPYPDLLVAGIAGNDLPASGPDSNFPVANYIGAPTWPGPGGGLDGPAFIARFSGFAPANPPFITYFGGAVNGSTLDTEPDALAVDSGGNIWVAGLTTAIDYPLFNPVVAGCGNAPTQLYACSTGFVSEFSPNGKALLFSTYLGGSPATTVGNGVAGDSVAALALSPQGSVLAAGSTHSAAFPTTPGAYYSTCCGAFVTNLASQPAPTAPTISVTANPLPTAFVGGDVYTEIVVTNTATSGPDLLVSNVTNSGNGDYRVYPDAEYVQYPECQLNPSTPNPVAPGSSCEILVYWFPEIAGVPDPLTVNIYDNAVNAEIPQIVTYSPTALNGPQATVTGSGNFGNVLQGSTSSVTLTLTNTGNSILTVTSPSGSNPGLTGSPDFSIVPAATSPCPLTQSFFDLTARSTCNVAVVYRAQGPPNTPETAAFTFADNSITPPGPTQTVTLSATTVPPEPSVSVSPNPLVFFGTVAEGAPSVAGLVRISNNGNATLTINNVTPAFGTNGGDFQVVNPCNGTIAPFGSCSLGVEFIPSTTSAETAQLQITSNDPVSPTLDVTLNGTGGAAPGPPASLPFQVSEDNYVPPGPGGATQASAASSGGEFVAFTSQSPNELPGPAGGYGLSSAYVRNTCNGSNAPAGCHPSTQFVAYGPVGGPAGNGGAACVNQQQTFTSGASNPAISADGRYVAFNDDACPLSNANAPQIEPGPIYLRDLQANFGLGLTTAVTDASGNLIEGKFSMSGDARYFAYTSGQSGHTEIYATDTGTPTTVLVSQNNSGVADGGTQLSAPAISPDGRYVAFASNFDDVVGVAGNGTIAVFVRDTCFGAPSGCVPSTNLVLTQPGGNNGTDGIAISAGGRFVAFTNEVSGNPPQVYMVDTQLDITNPISAAVNGGNVDPQISADGRIVTFVNEAGNFLYSFDTCTSNGTPVGGTCQPGLLGVISATTAGTTNVQNSFGSYYYSLDPTGQTATYTGGQPDGCTSCFQVWENAAGAPVAPPPPAIVTASLPPGVVGQPYDQTILTSGGVPPVNVAFTQGTLPFLPPNVSLQSNQITGTPTAAGSDFTFSVTATDSDQVSSAPQAYTLAVTCPVIGIVTHSPLPQPLTATVNAPITLPNFVPVLPAGNTLQVNLGTQGNLDGLTFSNGVLSGFPTAPGTFPITITASGDGCSAAGFPISLVVNGPAITTVGLVGGTVGQPYSATILTLGGYPPVNVSPASGSGPLPPGLGISGGDMLAGTPSAPGTYSFTLDATDKSGYIGPGQPLSLAVACPTITLTPQSPIPATVPATAGTSLTLPGFSVVLPAGNTLATTFVASGNLDGLNFNPATGALSGTPAAAGTFTIVIGAIGGGCGSASGFTITLVVAPAAVACALPASGISITYGAWVRTGLSSTWNQTITLNNSGPAGTVYFVLGGLSGANFLSATERNSAGTIATLPAVQTTCNSPGATAVVVQAGPGQTVFALHFTSTGGGIHYTAAVVANGTP